MKRVKYNLPVFGGNSGDPLLKLSNSEKKGQVKLNVMGRIPLDVWNIPTSPFKGSHFATFPPRLIERLIKAGCPQEVCKKCGQPKRRVVQKDKILNIEESNKRKHPLIKPSAPHDVYTCKSVGWVSCDCNAGFKRGVVLDPFVGSGTTCLVAKELGRDCIGIEAAKEYIDIAKQRLDWGKNKDVDYIFKEVKPHGNRLPE